MLTVDDLHAKILYPIVKIRASNAGGSGVLIYSEPDPQHKGRYINLALSCEHVIDNAVKIRDEWDPVMKLERKREVFEEVGVEVFDYDGSQVISANSTQADIIGYDKYHDIALLKLHNFRKMDYVASIIPESAIADLRIFSGCWVCGCSLLHDPFANPGTLTYLREIIEQKSYLMANASSVFGNSGGGLFHESGDLLGLTSRISTIQLGFGIDVMTWMGFSTHPERLYEFFRDQEFYDLLFNGGDYYEAMDKRKRRQEEAMRHLLVGSGDQAPSVPAPEPAPDAGGTAEPIP